MPSSTQQAAKEYVDEKFAQGKSNSWPKLDHNEVHRGLLNRIEKPELIWQSKTNLCGMATFFHALATDDPYFYAYYVHSMYRNGTAYLGYSKDSRIAKAGKIVRGSDVPPNMAHVDWLALASLRDYFNDFLGYEYRMGSSFVKYIPVYGLPFREGFLELQGAVTMPEDLEAMLGAVGWTVHNLASRHEPQGETTLAKINSYLDNGHNVLMLTTPGIVHFDFDGSREPKSSGNMLHWVRVMKRVESKAKHFKSNSEDGLRFHIYNPGGDLTLQTVPFNGTYVRRSVFLNNFYGIIAARK